MQKLSIVMLMSATLIATSACATKKYVTNSVKASSDTLTARIETNEGELKEVRDNTDRKVSGVDSRVTDLDNRTSQGLNSLKGDVQNADQRAAQAQGAADRASNDVNSLNQQFQNRNLFNVTAEKSVQFKFDSAKLDKQYMDVLDEIAETLTQNPDAIVVLEGRTDSVGNKDY